MRRAALLLALALGLTLASEARAQGTPNLDVVTPRGGQRGTSLTITCWGRRLAEPQQLLCYRPGIEVLSFEEVRNERWKGEVRAVRIKVRLAPECPLGEHPLRLRTATGVTELRTFWVGSLPELNEKEPNGQLNRAQPVPLERTINGRVTREDLDLYRFEGKQGQRITAELVAMRLGHRFFDASLAILDEGRFELAKSDDTAFAGQDPVASCVLPKDGTYFVRVRESTYRGDGNCRYRLHLGTFPRPTASFPLGGRPGEALSLRYLGEAAGVSSETLTLPVSSASRCEVFPRAGEAQAQTPLPLALSEHEGVLEREPNDRKRAQKITLPAAIDGVLEKTGDHDFFTFSAKKGQTFMIQLRARSLGSPLDGVVNVWDRLGQHRVGNDDNRREPDSVVRFRAPETKDYDLRVRDFLNRGGPDFVYRLEISPARPALELAVHRFGREGNQDRQAVALPQGNRMAVLVRVRRQGFNTPVALDVAGLTSGVTVHAPDAPPGASVVPLVFEAHPRATPAGSLLAVQGRAVGNKAPRGLSGSLRHRVELTTGNPNRAVYAETEVGRLALGVTKPAPFRLHVEAPKAPLVRNGYLELALRIERAEGFKGDVRLDPLYDPPGWRARRGLVLKQGQTEATLRIDANGKAVLGRWPIVILARTQVGGGPLWTSSRPIMVEAVTPVVTMAFERGSVTLGGETELTCKVTVHRPFAGEARARLYRLPGFAKSVDLVVNKDTKLLRFPVEVAAKGKGVRPGRFRGIFARVSVPHAGGTIEQHAGWTELRVDKPRPQPKAQPKPKQPPPKPAAQKPAAKPKKPLSQLERLRQEYERQKAAEGAQP
ncbi:MAG TPA: hypothetical protein DEA08_27215 [Planctomycetes bacterium]|nr:hypothetical protein [Planctomycetota bacterium]